MKEKFLKWAEKVANHKNAVKWLFWVSFAESSISPFPAYFLVLFILAHKVKHSWQKVAFFATLGSLLGGIVGHLIGFYFYKFLGAPILNFYHLQNQFLDFGDRLRANELVVLLIAAITPIPYKITSIASGVFAINFPLFLLTTIVGRGVKFIVISFLTKLYGEKMKNMMSESIWSTIISFIVICLLVYFIFFR